ncbi:PREDICTED: centromere protein T-like [Odobenus rosmarus divergens]|uniref:Centromere protein T-like n=1 Tax=Odobenus rosmarus divergens TaxID=9708 RepID=A0A9B0HBF2_ODORO
MASPYPLAVKADYWKPKSIKTNMQRLPCDSHQPPELTALQTRTLTAPLSSTAAFSSEPLEPLSTRLPPRAQTPGLRPHQDPHKTGLRHYVKLFSFCTKMPMENKALEMVEECLDKYFQHLYEDLEVFAMHVGCKTMRPEDLEHLMQWQGLVNDQVSLYVLVEQHLPLEYWPLFIPCAFTGNSVFPAQQWSGLNTHPVPTCGHLAPRPAQATHLQQLQLWVQAVAEAVSPLLRRPCSLPGLSFSLPLGAALGNGCNTEVEKLPFQDPATPPEQTPEAG